MNDAAANTLYAPEVLTHIVVRRYKLCVESRYSTAWDAQFPDGEIVTFVVQPAVARLLGGAIPAYNEAEVREALKLWGPKIARGPVDIVWALGSEPR